MTANTHIWCPNCEAIRPINARGMPGTDVSEGFTNVTDLCCAKCRLVVATTYLPIED